MPATEQEILAAIEAGDLVETASFDAKASLPAILTGLDCFITC